MHKSSNYQTILAKVIYLVHHFKALKRFFVLTYDATDNNEAGIKNDTKYFLPRRKI